MKHLKYISIISIMALITAPAVADIASSEYVDSVVGTMTQSAINTALSNKQDKLPPAPNDGKKYSLIWNGSGFAFEEFTTGGGSTSIDWNAIEAYLASAFYSDEEEKNPSSHAEYSLIVPPEYVPYYGDTGCSYGYVYYETAGGDCSNQMFAGMVAGDWYVDIPSPINVKIEGRALCSSTNGIENQPGDPDGSGSGVTKYCWCKMTSPAASRWVFNSDFGGVGDCTAGCATGCSGNFQSPGNSAFRSALFGAVGQ